MHGLRRGATSRTRAAAARPAPAAAAPARATSKSPYRQRRRRARRRPRRSRSSSRAGPSTRRPITGRSSRGRHPGLEVVEQRVVGVLVRRSTRRSGAAARSHARGSAERRRSRTRRAPRSQACSASEVARAVSARSSAGTRRAFSHVAPARCERRVERPGSSPLVDGLQPIHERRSGGREPLMAQSRSASRSARPAPRRRRRGIFVRSSQASSARARPRSEISRHSPPRRRGDGRPPSAAAATASSRTGIPFRCAIPASRSRSSGSEEASRLTLAPPAAFGDAPAAAVAPAVRDRDRAALDLVGDRRRRSRSSRAPRLIRQRSPSSSPSASASSGWIAGGVGAPAAHQQRRVVHPGVVRAQLAQADQPQREVGVVAVARRQPLAPPRAISGGSRRTRLLAVADLLAHHVRRQVLGEHDPVRVARAASRG